MTSQWPLAPCVVEHRYFQTFADAGVQYFVVETLDAADEEAIRLLGEQVVPRVRAG